MDDRELFYGKKPRCSLRLCACVNSRDRSHLRETIGKRPVDIYIRVSSNERAHRGTVRRDVQAAAAEVRAIEGSFKTQGAWGAAQKTAMEHRRALCAHLLSLVTRELEVFFQASAQLDGGSRF